MFNSLGAEKTILPQASLQATEKRTAMPVPAMVAENVVRKCGSWGPDFFNESIAVFPCRFLSTIMDRRLSHAWR